MRPIPVIIAIGFAIAPFVPGPVQGQAIGPGLVMSDADADQDGRLSRDEYLALRDREFERFDRNDDDQLGRDDFPGAAYYRRALGRLEDRIADADKDGDGLISRTELRNAPTYMFDKADTFRNGYLSRSEIEAAQAALAGIR